MKINTVIKQSIVLIILGTFMIMVGLFYFFTPATLLYRLVFMLVNVPIGIILIYTASDFLLKEITCKKT